jgi:hypothetical protein
LEEQNMDERKQYYEKKSLLDKSDSEGEDDDDQDG